MKDTPAHISILTRKAGLSIHQSANGLTIRQSIRFTDKSFWGLVFWAGAGIWIVVMSLFKLPAVAFKVAGSLTGSFVLLFSLLTIYRQARDYVNIENGMIRFRYNLKTHIFPVTDDMAIKMAMEVMGPWTRYSTQSFFVVTYFLEMQDSKIRILSFQMENEENARQLDKKLTALLKKELRNIS